MYEDWTKEELISKIRELRREIESLKDELEGEKIKNNSLEFKIEQELEPRLQAEKRRYDNWVTNPERW